MPWSLSDLTTPNITSVSAGDRPIDGSSNITTSGFDIMALPIASICCSPPDRVPANWSAALTKPLEQLIDEFEAYPSGRLVPAFSAPPIEQIVLDGKRAEDLAALGDLGDAHFADLPGRQPRDIDPFILTDPRDDGTIPAIERIREVLPAPLAPTTQISSPLLIRSDTPFSALEPS